MLIDDKGDIKMIRERVQNNGVIPRHCLITNYNAFVLINKYDASKISLYKKDWININNDQAYYIRLTNKNGVGVEMYTPTETFNIFDEDYDAFIADNIEIDFDIVYDKKPYTN